MCLELAYDLVGSHLLHYRHAPKFKFYHDIDSQLFYVLKNEFLGGVEAERQAKEVFCTMGSKEKETHSHLPQ